MKSKFVLAQLEQKGLPEENLENAKKAVAEAMELYKPDLMVFPECFMSHFPMGTDRATCLGTAQTLDGPFVTGMKALAKDNGIWIIFGMNEKVEDPSDDRNYNCNKPGDHFFEPIDTPFGKIGLFVCYEVRFPEVARYQRSKGADIIIMPTAWVPGPLKSPQFRTLISARAIENTVYMVACDQVGANAMGESVVVDPMGVVVASAGEVETLICAEIDTDRVEKVRAKLPAYKDRRPELYTI